MADDAGTVRAQQEDHWTLDKRIPLALIATMMLQFATVVWFVRGLDSRLEQLEAFKVRTETIDKNRDQQIQTVELKLARIEERQNSMIDLIKELKVSIDKLIDRRG
jgi:hypothetical protein